MSNQTLDGSGAPYPIPVATTVTVADGNTLTLLGTIANAGTIFDDSTGDSTPILLATAQVLLTGAGSVVLSTVPGGTQAPPNNIQTAGGGADTLVNVNDTISGAGGIYVTLDNQAQGIVDATGPAGESLYLSSGGVNSGLMEATGAGGLELSGTVDQTGGGDLLASGAGLVTLFEADIAGGTLTTAGGGTISSTYATIDGTAAAVTIAAGSTLTTRGYALYVEGTIVNQGTLAFASADLIGLAAGMTLTGGGTVALNNASVFSPGALVNMDNLLIGYGYIGNGSTLIALSNLAHGVIDATNTMNVFSTATIANAGLIEANGTGVLTLNNATVENAGGGTLLANGAGAIITGINIALPDGVLQAENGGAFQLTGTLDTLGSVSGTPTILAGTFIQMPLSTTLEILSATVANAGTIGIGNTAYYDNTTSVLALAAPVTTLTGGGVVDLLFDYQATNTAQEIVSASGAVASLVNADNTIEGVGTIGTASGPVALTNEAAGLIDASGDQALTIAASFILRNAGTMESTHASLTISGGTVDNQGGTIAAYANAFATNTGLVTLTGEDIEGGVLLSDVIGNNPYNAARGAITFAAGDSTLDGSAAPLTVTGSGTLGVAAGASLDLVGHVLLANGAIANSGLLRVDGSLDGAGAVTGTLANAGVVRADGGTLAVSGDVTGSGSIALAGGAAFLLGGATGETIDFAGMAGSTLDLAAPTGFAGTLGDLASGDVIVLGGTDVTGAPTIAGSVLQVAVSGGATLDLQLANAPAGESFQLLSASSSQSVLELACYAGGTRIATPTGEIPVEHLRIGDRVTLARGGSLPVKWIGHRRVDCAAHPNSCAVRPMRVRAHAFGRGAPHRDLLLSPDHAVFADGVLIPVRYLVNGTTIRQEWPDEVTYWHVELERHEVILADGLPCESYLDTGNRAAFANAGPIIQLHPDFAPSARALELWRTRACARLVLGGPGLEAARRSVLAHARSLGFLTTRAPALRFRVHGRMLVPEVSGNRHVLALPAGTTAVELVSRHGVPAETSAGGTDRRRLGVAVSRIAVDGKSIAMTGRRLGRGWHAHEGSGIGWRWTDGAAELAVPAGRSLAVEVAMTESYWLESKNRDRSRAPAGAARASGS
jgi:hypothetical protein